MQMEQCAKNQVYINELNANPADITTIYEVLCSCDPIKLLEAVLNIELGRKESDALPAPLKERLSCGLVADLEVMKNLAPDGIGEREVVQPGKYFEALKNIPWSNALAKRVWLPESLTEHERYFIIGQIFSAITDGSLSNMLSHAA